MANLRVDIASEFTGAAAFKKAGKASTGLEKSVKKLGKSLALALSVSAVTSFGNAAVKAFMDDQKAAANLANTLKNLGVGFAVAMNEDFIQKLEKATNVADDQLRPALSKLITQTGSLTYAQELLTKSIDISRGSGVDLQTVASDLANAYVGNTKGLKKYALGFSSAELATMSFSEIMVALNKQFAGSSAAYLQTYAGKMDALSLASNNAKETIGKGLLDALTLMAGGGAASITSVTDSIGAMSTVFADTIRGIGYYVGELMKNPFVAKLWNIVKWFSKNTSFLGVVAKTFAPKGKELNAPDATPELSAAEKAILKMQREHALRQAALIKKQKEAADKELKLRKSAALFDMEHIQLIAALKGQVSDEDRKRLELQLSILDGNTAEAEKLTKEIAMSIDKTGKLAASLATLPDAKNPFVAWKGYLDDIELQAKRVAAFSAAAATTPASIVASYVIPDLNKAELENRRESGQMYGSGNNGIVIQIDGKEVVNAVVDQAMSGNNAYLNRRLGGFD